MILTIEIETKWITTNYVFEIKEVKQDEIAILREICADRQKDVNLLVQEVKRSNERCTKNVQLQNDLNTKYCQLSNDHLELGKKQEPVIWSFHANTMDDDNYIQWESRLNLNADDYFELEENR
eukprot:UN01343